MRRQSARAHETPESGPQSTTKDSDAGAVPRLQFEPKSAPFPQLGGKAYSTAHPLGCFFDDRQANTGPFIAFAEPLEYGENAFVGFFWNADAVVLHVDAQVGGGSCAAIDGLRPNTNFRLCAPSHELHSVAQEV